MTPMKSSSSQGISGLDMAGIFERHSRVHQWTQEHYERDGEKGLARRLGELRSSRNDADYSTERHITRKEAAEAMSLSQQIRAELRVLAGRRLYLERSNGTGTADPVNPP
ncbi:hypothetical protein PV762_20715 [Mitsuaria sp. CC2]|uniref:hypothetical protein n=1 Tax=Mitsuaria sp. CC2 TaxID=3029186 RepID=UPI003B8A9EB1